MTHKHSESLSSDFFLYGTCPSKVGGGGYTCRDEQTGCPSILKKQWEREEIRE